MSADSVGDLPDPVSLEAADWFARLRAADGDADRAAFEAWYAADPRHAETYDRLVRRWDQTAFLAGSTMVRERDLSRARSRWADRRHVAAVAAVAAVLSLGGYTMLHRQAPPAAIQRLVSRDTEIRSVTLADGTHVTLDSASAVRVPGGDSPAFVLERGRARFDFAGTRPARFAVAAGGLSLSGDQSVFDLQLKPGAVEIALLRGRLAIMRPGSKTLLTLPVGRRVSVSATGDATAPAAIARGDLLWAEGMLSFDGTRLGDAVAAFNRTNRRQIVLEGHGLADRRVTGAFRIHDPAGFTAAAATALGLDRRGDPKGNLVLTATPPSR